MYTKSDFFGGYLCLDDELYINIIFHTQESLYDEVDTYAITMNTVSTVDSKHHFNTYHLHTIVLRVCSTGNR